MVLQFGVPGGPELLIVLLIAVLVFGLPVLLIGVVGFLYLRSDGDDYEERISELESEIARLEAEVAADGDGAATSETGDVSSADRDATTENEDVSAAIDPSAGDDSERRE